MKGKRKIPQRQCVGCREMKDKNTLIRILKTASEDIEIDTSGRKNGRGAYICFSNDCLDKAIKTKGLERSLKATIPEDVYSRLREEMAALESE